MAELKEQLAVIKALDLEQSSTSTEPHSAKGKVGSLFRCFCPHAKTLQHEHSQYYSSTQGTDAVTTFPLCTGHSPG